MDSVGDSPLAIVAGHQTKPPVDLDAISRDLGVSVSRRPLGREVAGMLVKDQSAASGFSIYINSSEHPNRQRFTHAHELAHFILHRDLIDSGLTDDTMYRSALSNFYEVQANKLAADILMPIRLVKKWKLQEADTKKLARIFGVSEQAMKIRVDAVERGIATRQLPLFND